MLLSDTHKVADIVNGSLSIEEKIFSLSQKKEV